MSLAQRQKVSHNENDIYLPFQPHDRIQKKKQQLNSQKATLQQEERALGTLQSPNNDDFAFSKNPAGSGIEFLWMCGCREVYQLLYQVSQWL